tara:strand:+ start:123 stop:404 length:282 start_codon:yes stop_codon:yes gene_type:complete
MIITIENYISWRKSSKSIFIRYISGDTAVLSISRNGIDAEAMYIGSSLREYLINPGNWFTLETLGHETEVEANISSGDIIVASDDWKPTPLKS